MKTHNLTPESLFAPEKCNFNRTRVFLDLVAYFLNRRIKSSTAITVNDASQLVWTYFAPGLEQETDIASDEKFGSEFFRKCQALINKDDADHEIEMHYWLYLQHKDKINYQLQKRWARARSLKIMKGNLDWIELCTLMVKWDSSRGKGNEDKRKRYQQSLLICGCADRLCRAISARRKTFSAMSEKTMYEIYNLKKMANFVRKRIKLIGVLKNKRYRNALQRVKAIQFIPNTDKLHAEMCIYAQVPDAKYIGVSKPTCFCCNFILRRHRMEINLDCRVTNHAYDTSWRVPPFLIGHDVLDQLVDKAQELNEKKEEQDKQDEQDEQNEDD